MNATEILIIAVLVVSIIAVILVILAQRRDEESEKSCHPPLPCLGEKVYEFEPPLSTECPGCSLTNNSIPYDVLSTGESGFFSLGVQSTGQIVVGNGPSLYRFNADGTRDNTFGTGGVATLPSYGFNDVFRIEIGSGDLIYVTGTGEDLNISRYTANGILDTSFAGTGHFVGGPSQASSLGGVDLYVYQDNSVLASRGSDNIVYKITSAGIYDPAFNNISYSIPGFTVRRIANVVAYSDKIYLFGFIRDVNAFRFPFIGRANFDGTIDNTFGTNGYVIVTETDIGLTYLDVETYGGSTVDPANGDLYWVGSMDVEGNETDYYIGVIRLDQNGVIDSSYGSNGAVINPRSDLNLTGQFAEAYGNAVILPCDGSLLLIPYVQSDNLEFGYPWLISSQGVTISEEAGNINDQILYQECVPDGNGNIIACGQILLPGLSEPVLTSFSCRQVDYRFQDNAL